MAYFSVITGIYDTCTGMLLHMVATEETCRNQTIAERKAMKFARQMMVERLITPRISDKYGIPQHIVMKMLEDGVIPADQQGYEVRIEQCEEIERAKKLPKREKPLKIEQ